MSEFRMPARREPAWQRKGPLRILGVDPGFANTGLAVLEQSEGEPVRTCALQVVMTHKETKKRRGELAIRVSYDDSRRVREFFNELQGIINVWEPHVLCVETFAPFAGKGGGNAWKTAIVYGVTQSVALQRQLLLMTALPLDIKRAFSLNRGATKGEIAQALYERVPDLQALVERHPKGRREHITDAAAHAYLGFSQVAQARQVLAV